MKEKTKTQDRLYRSYWSPWRTDGDQRCL